MSEQTIPAPEMVPLETAASRLGIPRATAYRLRKEGNFPIRVVQIGSRFRVYRNDLDEFITGKPTAQAS